MPISEEQKMQLYYQQLPRSGTPARDSNIDFYNLESEFNTNTKSLETFNEPMLYKKG